MTVAAGLSTRCISTTMLESGWMTGLPSRAWCGGRTDRAGMTCEYGSIGASSRLHERHCCTHQPIGNTYTAGYYSPRPPSGSGSLLGRNYRIPTLCRSEGDDLLGLTSP